jgi:hypothetical protein
VSSSNSIRYRSPFAVWLLPGVTFGIYSWVWLVSTKREMVRSGANIPTSWLILVPFVNLWWMWQYCKGVAAVTSEETSAGTTFAVLFFLGTIGMAIAQHSLNRAVPSRASL